MSEPEKIELNYDRENDKGDTRRLKVRLTAKKREFKPGSLKLEPKGEVAQFLKVEREQYQGSTAYFDATLFEKLQDRIEKLAAKPTPFTLSAETTEDVKVTRDLLIQINFHRIGWTWWELGAENPAVEEWRGNTKRVGEERTPNKDVELVPDEQSGFELEVWLETWNPDTKSYEKKDSNENDFTHYLAPGIEDLTLETIDVDPLPWKPPYAKQQGTTWWWSTEFLPNPESPLKLPLHTSIRVAAYPGKCIIKRGRAGWGVHLTKKPPNQPPLVIFDLPLILLSQKAFVVVEEPTEPKLMDEEEFTVKLRAYRLDEKKEERPLRHKDLLWKRLPNPEDRDLGDIDGRNDKSGTWKTDKDGKFEFRFKPKKEYFDKPPAIDEFLEKFDLRLKPKRGKEGPKLENPDAENGEEDPSFGVQLAPQLDLRYLKKPYFPDPPESSMRAADSTKSDYDWARPILLTDEQLTAYKQLFARGGELHIKIKLLLEMMEEAELCERLNKKHILQHVSWYVDPDNDDPVDWEEHFEDGKGYVLEIPPPGGSKARPAPPLELEPEDRVPRKMVPLLQDICSNTRDFEAAISEKLEAPPFPVFPEAEKFLDGLMEHLAQEPQPFLIDHEKDLPEILKSVDYYTGHVTTCAKTFGVTHELHKLSYSQFSEDMVGALFELIWWGGTSFVEWKWFGENTTPKKMRDDLQTVGPGPTKQYRWAVGDQMNKYLSETTNQLRVWTTKANSALNRAMATFKRSAERAKTLEGAVSRVGRKLNIDPTPGAGLDSMVDTVVNQAGKRLGDAKQVADTLDQAITAKGKMDELASLVQQLEKNPKKARGPTELVNLKRDLNKWRRTHTRLQAGLKGKGGERAIRKELTDATQIHDQARQLKTTAGEINSARKVGEEQMEEFREAARKSIDLKAEEELWKSYKDHVDSLDITQFTSPERVAPHLATLRETFPEKADALAKKAAAEWERNLSEQAYGEALGDWVKRRGLYAGSSEELAAKVARRWEMVEDRVKGTMKGNLRTQVEKLRDLGKLIDEAEDKPDNPRSGIFYTPIYALSRVFDGLAWVVKGAAMNLLTLLLMVPEGFYKMFVAGSYSLDSVTQLVEAKTGYRVGTRTFDAIVRFENVCLDGLVSILKAMGRVWNSLMDWFIQKAMSDDPGMLPDVGQPFSGNLYSYIPEDTERTPTKVFLAQNDICDAEFFDNHKDEELADVAKALKVENIGNLPLDKQAARDALVGAHVGRYAKYYETQTLYVRKAYSGLIKMSLSPTWFKVEENPPSLDAWLDERKTPKEKKPYLRWILDCCKEYLSAFQGLADPKFASPVINRFYDMWNMKSTPTWIDVSNLINWLNWAASWVFPFLIIFAGMYTGPGAVAVFAGWVGFDALTELIRASIMLIYVIKSCHTLQIDMVIEPGLAYREIFKVAPPKQAVAR